MQTLDFEKPATDLETKIEELRHLSDGGRVNIATEIDKLQEKVNRQLQGIYNKLTPVKILPFPPSLFKGWQADGFPLAHSFVSCIKNV